MSLKDIQIPKVDVQVGTSSFAVRGLSALDIDILVRKQGPAMQELFGKFISGGKKKKVEPMGDIQGVLKEVLMTAPTLVLDVLSLAADAKDAQELEALATLPASVQVQALISVVSLTLAGSDDMGKFVDAALKLTQTLNGGLGALLVETTAPKA